MTTEEIKNIADLPIRHMDPGAETIGDYLRFLLTTLWKEAEGFSGKRPFGNSGWQFDVYHVLVANGIIPGKIDESGDLQDVDEAAGEKVILAVIEKLRVASSQTLEALDRAEGFISGFEDDEMQTGMADLLATIRSAIATVKKELE